MDKKWCVAVGNPKWDKWKNFPRKPDLSLVGQRVCPWDKGYTFKTRDEARKEARRMSKTNAYWHYRAERIK